MGNRFLTLVIGRHLFTSFLYFRSISSGYESETKKLIHDYDGKLRKAISEHKFVMGGAYSDASKLWLN